MKNVSVSSTCLFIENINIPLLRLCSGINPSEIYWLDQVYIFFLVILDIIITIIIIIISIIFLLKSYGVQPDSVHKCSACSSMVKMILKT